MNKFLFLAAAGLLALMPRHAPAAPDKAAVLDTYGDIAHAAYEDSLATARGLKAAVAALIAKPGADTLGGARAAWAAARVPYQQSEVFRFGNPIVDEWEGRVNAWPLDEGLIDYVDAKTYGETSDKNALYTANVIATRTFKIGGRDIDAGKIDKVLLRSLHELGGVEANVATGYHAIEFLLWGQDLNGTGKGAGNRPATDFDPARCTGRNCDRRAAYLSAAVDLLIDDLAEMVAAWAPAGEARKALLANGADGGLTAMVTGMGSLSYGELAGERMKLGLMLHDPEEEHDCFSDNTHVSHYYDALGIRNVYLGEYTRSDGRVVKGPGLSSLVAAVAPAADKEMRAKLDATMAAMAAIVKTAKDGEAYDQMIGNGNAAGNAKVQAAIDGLVAQTRTLEKAVGALGISAVKFEGSDSLDNPGSVFK